MANPRHWLTGLYFLLFSLLASSLGDFYVRAVSISVSSFDFNTAGVLYQSAADWKIASDGLSRFATTPGAAIQLDFEGTQIRIYGARNSQGANFSVTIDNLPPVLGTSFLDQKRTSHILVFQSDQLENGKHTLRLQHEGNDRQAVDFQRYEVLSLLTGSEVSTASIAEVQSVSAPATAVPTPFSTLVHEDTSLHAQTATPSLPNVIPNSNSLPPSAQSSSIESSVDSATITVQSASASLSVAPVITSSSLSTLFSSASSSITQNQMILASALSGVVTGIPTSSATTPLLTSGTAPLPQSETTSAASAPASADPVTVQAPPLLRVSKTDLPLILSLSIGVPLLALLALLTFRYCLKSRRQGKILRWSKERGLRYSLDFECRGEAAGEEEADRRSEMGQAHTVDASYPSMRAMHSIPTP